MLTVILMRLRKPLHEIRVNIVGLGQERTHSRAFQALDGNRKVQKTSLRRAPSVVMDSHGLCVAQDQLLS